MSRNDVIDRLSKRIKVLDEQLKSEREASQWMMQTLSDLTDEHCEQLDEIQDAIMQDIDNGFVMVDPACKTHEILFSVEPMVLN